MRAIDGDELLGIERLLDTDVVRQSKTASWLLDQVLHDIQAMPTLTPPNEPLTLDELREMDGEPVWVDDKKTWALLQVWDDKNIDVVFPMPKGCFHAKSVNGRKIYRRPPEGEEDV